MEEQTHITNPSTQVQLEMTHLDTFVGEGNCSDLECAPKILQFFVGCQQSYPMTHTTHFYTIVVLPHGNTPFLLPWDALELHPQQLSKLVSLSQ